VDRLLGTILASGLVTLPDADLEDDSMVHTKRNLFAGFDWLVWKDLALVGIPLAVKKVKERATSHSTPTDEPWGNR